MGETQRIAVRQDDGTEVVLYEPLPHQILFHESDAPNLLALGTRGTGKSLTSRFDAIIRCLIFPNFRALVVRRTMPELRRSHLAYIDYEMKQLGGVYLQTVFQAKFPNGSTIQFAHCETQADILNFLSSEYGAIYFDELSTFSIEQFLQISAACRAPVAAPYKAVIRAASNPLGPGAAWMKAWFVDRDVNYADYPDYHPDDFKMIFSTLEDNPHLDRKAYTARLKNLPEHVRKAWLLGEFVIEGAYFTEFLPINEVEEGGDEKVVPWHCIDTLPTWQGQSILTLDWVKVVRSIDWGYFPDPAVCHWHLVLPNKHKITFKEQQWTRTLAKDVAKEIQRLSEGMHITESFCDPTMFVKDGAAPFSIGEIFEQHGVPLTPSQNSRELYGYAVHELLGSRILNDEGFERPGWQIVKPACPNLVRTIPIMQMDPTDTRKLADGPDHWVVSCAYFSMGGAPPSIDPVATTTPRWMRPKSYRHHATC